MEERKGAKLRILMVGQFARRKGENDGGVSAAMSYLADALLECPGVELVGARLGATSADEPCDGSLGFPVHNIATKSLGLLTGFRDQRRRFKEIVSNSMPDIVHGHGADLGGYLACRSGRPSIVTVHGIIGQDAQYKSKLADRLRQSMISRFFERPVVRQADSLIVISPYVARYYGNEIKGQVHEIPNPVGPEYFDIVPQPCRGRILYAGKVAPIKGIVDLVSAFARLNEDLNPHLLIAGSLADGKYVQDVRRAIADLGIADRVELVGFLSDDELIREFARSQALVLPSYQENAPMVILQAMAARLPVVASRVGGVPFQVSEEATGLMFTPGDISALHAHLDTLLSDVELAARMGDAGRKVAAMRFRAASVAAETLTAYRATIADAARKSAN